MRILLLHPEDSPLEGPWTNLRWDLIVDLGWAGSSQYEAWREQVGCQFRSVWGFADWKDDVRQIRKTFEVGNGCLIDAEGIDWWDLIAPTRVQRFYELLLLRKLAREISPLAEVWVTRPHPMADTLGKLLGARISAFTEPSPIGVLSWFQRSAKKVSALTHSQVVRVALDKWDTDYRFRRFFTRSKRASGSEPKILLPSAYQNVTRVLMAYASVLPDRSFLLVTTRADGIAEGAPPNLTQIPLAAYASIPNHKATEREIAALTAQWQSLETRFRQVPELGCADAAGLFPDCGRILRNGLRIRDAWRAVFERETISSVLCGDENNAYLRLPVLLAKSRGVRTVYCSHGALDTNVLLRGVCSDTYLVKGEMEADYLAGQSGVPRERILLGAPPLAHPRAMEDSELERNRIVFFSEPYELYSGRTETLYRELLPPLCAVARKYGRKVIVKLHPFESAKARSQLVQRILTGQDQTMVEIAKGPLSDRLLRQTWFGLTVESSVAVECALAGIPCFLCGWFDLGLHNYGRQYEKYGAARVLDRPGDVLDIPEMLGGSWPAAEVASKLYQPIAREDLDALLHGSGDTPAKAALPAR